MNSIKRYLIIGGGGFIGSFLTQYLCDKGLLVSVIGRSNIVFPISGVQYFSLEVNSLSHIVEVLQEKGVDTIIDLAYATLPNTSYANPVQDFSDNLSNIIQYLEASLKLGVKRYIYVSSGGTVYGDNLEHLPLLEDSQNYPLSPYGITKMACERYVYMYHKLHGLPVTIVRPSNIYGPGQKPFRGQGLIATALGLAYQNKPIEIFGIGDSIRDYIYIEDFCDALFSILKLESSAEIFNIGCGEGISISALVNAIEKVLLPGGYSLRRKYSPERPFDVHYNVLNINKVVKQTGWMPTTSLEAGLKTTWKWIQAFMKNNHS